MDEMRFIEKLNSDNMIFHYTTSKTAIEDILPKNTLKLSKLINTNDPYEYKFMLFGGVGWGKVTEELIRDKHNPASTLLNKMRRNYCKIACFTMNGRIKGYLKTRMWTQYGDNHKGVCFVFNKDKLVENIKNQIEVLKEGKVIYNHYKEYENITFDFNELDKIEIDVFCKKYLNEKIEYLLFQKEEDFKDEVEYRIIAYKEDSEDKYIDIGNSLVAIIIGDRFPDGLLPSLSFFSKIIDVPCRRVYWEHGVPHILYCGTNGNKYEDEYDKLGLNPNKI